MVTRPERLKIFDWGGGRVLEAMLHGWDDWGSSLIRQFYENSGNLEKSHYLGGRFENLYLPVDKVPSVRDPIRLARAMGEEKLRISSVILFEPVDPKQNPYPPFWFNCACPGESTGLHDHAQLSKLSGVFYLEAEPNAGNLFFHKEGFFDLEIIPEVGKLVLFEPWMRHGVRVNKSSKPRLSLAFNLFPFPLPDTNF